jgi:hypothetical protein
MVGFTDKDKFWSIDAENQSPAFVLVQKELESRGFIVKVDYKDIYGVTTTTPYTLISWEGFEE